MNDDIEFSEILDEISDYLKDNILAEDFLNIEEDVINDTAVHYIVLDSEDEEGKVVSERICTIYPSVFENPTYDAGSVAEIFSSAFLFLRILDSKFKTINKEAVELKALKQLLRLSLKNLLALESKTLKLVDEQQAKEEGINLQDFKSYWSFIEGIIGPFDDDLDFAFVKKATSEHKAVKTEQENNNPSFTIDFHANPASSDIAVLINEDGANVVLPELPLDDTAPIAFTKDITAEVFQVLEIPSVEEVKTESAEQTVIERETLEPNLKIKAETNGAYVTSSPKVELDNLVVGIDFSSHKDVTVFSANDNKTNTHYSQEMMAVSK